MRSPITCQILYIYIYRIACFEPQKVAMTLWIKCGIADLYQTAITTFQCLVPSCSQPYFPPKMKRTSPQKVTRLQGTKGPRTNLTRYSWCEPRVQIHRELWTLHRMWLHIVGLYSRQHLTTQRDGPKELFVCGIKSESHLMPFLYQHHKLIKQPSYVLLLNPFVLLSHTL